MSKNDVELTIGADATGLTAVLQKAQTATNEAAEKMKSSLEKVNGAFEKISGAFATLGSIAAGGIFAEIIKSTNEFTEGAINLGVELGVSTQQAAAYNFAIKEVGGTSADISQALQGLSRRLKTQEHEMNHMGIATRDAHGHLLNMNTILFNAIDAVNSYSEGADRNLAAQEAFGRGVSASSAILRLHRDDIEAADARLKQLGITLNGPAKEAFEKNRKQMADLELVGQAISVSIGQTLIPVLLELGKAFAGEGSNGVEVFGAIVKETAILVESFATGLHELGNLIGGVAAAGAAVAHLDFAGAKTIWNELKVDQAKIIADGDAAVARLRSISTTPKPPGENSDADDKPAPGKHFDIVPTHTKKEHDGHAAELAAMNRLIEDKRRLIRQELADIDKEMTEEVEVAKVGYKAQLDAKVSSLDQQMAATKEAEREGLIGPMQAFQQERDLLQQKLAAQTEYYEKLKGLAVGNAVELAKLNADEQKSQLDYLREVEHAHQQAAAQVDQHWQGLADRMANGFTNAFATMMQGTMNFHQMMQKMLQQMLVGFVHMEAESVARHLAAEAAKSQASVVSGQVQQAAATDSSQQGLMVGGMAAIKKVMNDAYQAASGAFQAVVGIPYIGPILAPPAAAAAFAAVAAFGGNIHSASGGYDIPSGVNPMTQLHQREMVLPSHLADPMREMLGGGGRGGGEIHMHVHANDADSFRQMLAKPAYQDAVAAAVRGAHGRFAL